MDDTSTGDSPMWSDRGKDAGIDFSPAGQVMGEIQTLGAYIVCIAITVYLHLQCLYCLGSEDS